MNHGSLTQDQVDHYWRDGYVHQIEVLTADEVAAFRAGFDEAEAAGIAAHDGAWDKRDYRPWEHDNHPFADWIVAIARHPKILDAVASILGEDILIRNGDIFVKNPGVRRGIGWHVDTAELGEDADGMLTAWIGLTPSTAENGCLRFSAGSHRRELPNGPQDRFSLTLKKEAVAALDPSDTVLNLMGPGMMSMHHFRTVHSSSPNRSQDRRIAFVGRYMATRVTQATAESGQATLVRGTDRFGHFSLKDRFPMSWSG